jgi:ribonuclease BN (tRNA processing enzyme)
MYHEDIVAHVEGVSLLIHEACYNDGDPPDKPGKHSQPKQAALAAKKAKVGRLALIHATPHFRERKVEAARKIFPNTFWPRDGETVSV